ncbi:MAG TPA: TolC family protein [Longimicrobiales bacterium]
MRNGARTAARVTILTAFGLGLTAGEAMAQAAAGGQAPATAQAPAGAGAAPVTMTLDQAVAAAVQNSPQVVQGQGLVRNAVAGERAAKGAFLPSLSLSTGAAWTGNGVLNGATGAAGSTGASGAGGVPTDATRVAGVRDSYTAGLSASMDVFDGGKRTADLAKSRAVSAQADASLLAQQYAAGFNARSSFFDVLRAGELASVARAQQQQAETALGDAQKRFKAGAATRSDVLRAQLAVTQAEQALSQARSQQTTNQYALGRAVGYDGPVLPKLTTSLDPRPLALSAAQLDSLVTTQAPAVTAAEAAVRIGTAGISAARSQYLPQLKVSAGYDWANQNTAFTGGQDGWALRATVDLPIFDGFQREQAVTEAKTAADVASANLEDARRGQRLELEKDLSSLTNAQNQIQLGQQAVQAAQEDLRVQQERYRLGAGTMLEVITSQTSLAQAQQSLVNARYGYQVARAALETLAGRSL